MTDPSDKKTVVSSEDITATLGVARGKASSGRSRRLFLAGGVMLLVVVTMLFLGRHTAGDRTGYQTQETRRGNLTVTVSATGTLQPTNQVEVGSEISGTIKSVLVNYNEHVKRGQVLALIDTARLEAQKRQTAASLDAARARVLQARATASEAQIRLARLVRLQETSGGKAPAMSDIDSARAALERAQADEANARATVVQAEASLDAQRIDLEKSVIRSPINGLVLKRSVEPGQTVAASLQTPVLFTIAEDLTRMELRVDVDEADVGKVKEGQSVNFTVAAWPDRSFPARVNQVRFGSKTVSGVVTYETILVVDNSSLLLRPGMTGTASIVVQKAENALLVPNSALRFVPPAETASTERKGSKGGSLLGKIMPLPPAPAMRPQEGSAVTPNVWLLRNNVLEKVAITTGMTDGTWTEVKGGCLQPGMAVAVDLLEAGK